MGREPPLVSCLMLSRNRLAIAMRSMRFYHDQRYPNLELVVVSQGTEEYINQLARHAQRHGIRNVRVVAAEPGLPIGALRNISLESAHGDIVCQWDDDDCYHPERVSRQFQELTQQDAQACYLADHLHLLLPSRRVYWNDWTRNEAREHEYRVLPGTVMMVNDHRRRYPENGPRADCGEDLSMGTQLYRTVPVATVHAMGWLYLYVFHGSNTMSEHHHERLTIRRRCHDELLTTHAVEISLALRYFCVERPLHVCGSKGTVFSVK